MSDFGIGTWDAAGNYNNYGIKPVSVIQVIHLSAGQNSGTYSFNDVPAGMRVGFVMTLETGASPSVGRRVVASGNTITISPASTAGYENYTSNEVDMVVFLENI